MNALSKAGTVVLFFILLSGCDRKQDPPLLNHNQLAAQYYGADSQWYLATIPFFECSDKQIEQVYYYRWKMYKAHLRSVGANSWVVTEFINHVPWDREPFCTINAAAMHHIYEGRWLKDPRYMDGYIDYLFQQGGNDRRYSESVADAAYARFLVNADSAFIVAQLDSMMSIYNQWDDHWEEEKNLYYIPAMPDATEYTIASIDASGGKDGFEGGDAFRPTINSYMYGNALAIARVAAMKGDKNTALSYLQRAVSLKSTVEKNLWNASLQHFTDRFKVNNQFVKYWDFIRGRELAGMAPWYFNLPADQPGFGAAWKHVTDNHFLLGKYGLRTNEPSYEYYFKQFVFFEGKPGSQWNGPSWPFQSSLAITAMANLLNDYTLHNISKTDYLKLLRLYTQQHFLPGGKINLVENYNPDKGGPIVHYYWSNHYNHSSYNNLIITGLCGIRPAAGDTLTINPLIDSSIHYFYLDDIRYRGHQLSVIYDKDGSRYQSGKGLRVLVDGKPTKLISKDSRYRLVVTTTAVSKPASQPVNVALNIVKKGFPIPSASVNAIADSLFQAIDGRTWYFPEITNYWNTLGAASTTDWYGLEFEKPVDISGIKIYPVVTDDTFQVPENLTIEYEQNGNWLSAIMKNKNKLTANTGNTIAIEKITTKKVRINFVHTTKPIAITEIECF